VLEHAHPGEVLEDVLADLEGGLDVEGHPGDDAQGTKPDDHPGEIGRVSAGDGEQFPVGGHDLQGAHGGGQVAVAVPRSVRGRCDGAGDGDVGQGGEVVQGESLPMQRLGERPVPGSAADGDGAGLGVHDDAGVQVLQRDQHPGRVGAVIERVA
jgi:hypothetical protein